MLGPVDIQDLLAAAAPLPLSKGAFKPATDACKIQLQDPALLFPAARNDRAALAGLLLRLGCWPESHAVAQDIHSTEGSYWHGIVHRIEPDSENAAYWFRRVGQHSIFPELSRRASEILKNNGPKHWRLKPDWDPFLFIAWCDEARDKGGSQEAAAIAIQMAEWQLLYHWCTQAENRPPAR
jgi:hypothetical protein